MTFQMSPRRTRRVSTYIQISKLDGRSCVAGQLASQRVIMRKGPEICGTLQGRVTRVCRRLGRLRGYDRRGRRLLDALELITRALCKLGKRGR